MTIDERLRRELQRLRVDDLDVERAVHATVAAGRRRVRRRRMASSAASLAVVAMVFAAVLVRLNGQQHASVTSGIGGDGAWTSMAAAPIAGRSGHTLVWTGREVIVWGGIGHDRSSFADGAAYDPATNHWRSISDANIPGRGNHGAAWTGTEMVVWGGVDAEGNGLTDGAAYNPATNRWHNIAPGPLSARLRPVVTWTGREILVVGGSRIQQGPITPEFVRPGNPGPAARVVDGAAYDPATDRWRSIAPSPVPESSPWTPAVWTGRDLIVMGGGPAVFAGSAAAPPGTPPSGLPIGAYDPATDRWDQLPSVPVAMNSIPWLTWTGSELIAAVSSSVPSDAHGAVRYDMETRAWTPLPAPPTADAQTQTAIWTGQEMVVAGRHGLALDPSVPRWRELPHLDAPNRLEDMKVVWAGDALVAWGGFNSGQQDWGGGALYRPGA